MFPESRSHQSMHMDWSAYALAFSIQYGYASNACELWTLINWNLLVSKFQFTSLWSMNIQFNVLTLQVYGYMSVVDSCQFSNTRIRVYRTSRQLLSVNCIFPSLEKQVDREYSLQLVQYTVQCTRTVKCIFLFKSKTSNLIV